MFALEKGAFACEKGVFAAEKGVFASQTRVVFLALTWIAGGCAMAMGKLSSAS
jgi:hypothetical protein